MGRGQETGEKIEGKQSDGRVPCKQAGGDGY